MACWKIPKYSWFSNSNLQKNVWNPLKSYRFFCAKVPRHKVFRTNCHWSDGGIESTTHDSLGPAATVTRVVFRTKHRRDMTWLDQIADSAKSRIATWFLRKGIWGNWKPYSASRRTLDEKISEIHSLRPQFFCVFFLPRGPCGVSTEEAEVEAQLVPPGRHIMKRLGLLGFKWSHGLEMLMVLLMCSASCCVVVVVVVVVVV